MKRSFIDIVKGILPRRKVITKHENCIMYELCGSELLTIHDKFQIPSYQNELNTEKIKNMKNYFFDRKDFFHLKNNIVFGVLPYNNELIYLIDGQHRYEMLKHLQQQLNPFITNQDYKFNVYFYNIIDDNYQIALFQELNQDSFKNQHFVSLGATLGKKVYDVSEQLKQNYIFSTKRKFSDHDKIFTLKEFMNRIHPYILAQPTANDVIYGIQDKFTSFKKHIGWFEYKSEEEEVYKRDSWISLTRINFIEYLLQDNVIPDVIPLSKRKSISSKLRKQIWEKEFGNKTEGKCPISSCSVILYKEDDSAFQCGHVIPKSRGGEDTLDNLRPICANCNARMNCIHWDEYDK
jgi:5-methylcytosine-specific restriction endonuclease McrA